MRTIALVSCVKSKRSGSWPAKELYTSTLFTRSRAYAERYADEWYVLSAHYGLLHPDRVVAYYEKTLKGAGHLEQRRWATAVYEQMKCAGVLDGNTRIVWLAGQDYQRELAILLQDVPSEDPLRGKSLGHRLSWLGANT